MKKNVRRAAAPDTAVDLHPGAMGLSVAADASVSSRGRVHVVAAGWASLCGAGDVRYRFPGRSPDSFPDTCPTCAAVATGHDDVLIAV